MSLHISFYSLKENRFWGGHWIFLIWKRGGRVSKFGNLWNIIALKWLTVSLDLNMFWFPICVVHFFHWSKCWNSISNCIKIRETLIMFILCFPLMWYQVSHCETNTGIIWIMYWYKCKNIGWLGLFFNYKGICKLLAVNIYHTYIYNYTDMTLYISSSVIMSHVRFL